MKTIALLSALALGALVSAARAGPFEMTAIQADKITAGAGINQRQPEDDVIDILLSFSRPTPKTATTRKPAHDGGARMGNPVVNTARAFLYAIEP